MKPVTLGKSRLAGAITDEQRVLLSVGLLNRVLGAGAGCDALEDLYVYGGDATVRAVCDRVGAHWREDPGTGLNGCMATAFSDAAKDGMDSAMFLPADLPLVTSQEMTRIVDAGFREAIAVAPDEQDDGTNALLIDLSSGFRTRLGESSFSLHIDEARERGVEPVVYRSVELGLDIDTLPDLDRLLKISPDFWSDLRTEIKAAGISEHLPVSKGS